MESIHPTTTRGVSPSHAPSLNANKAHATTEGGPNQRDEAPQQETAKHVPLADVREGHDDLSGLSETNLAQYSSLFVVYIRALETKRQDAIMNDPFAELLTGDAGGVLMQFFANMSPSMKTFCDFFAMRTRTIDEAIVNRHETIQQIVNLGAGFDSRAYRMTALSDCVVFEIDLSASMMERKQKLLDGANAPVLAKRRDVIIADLEQDVWQTELVAKGFDPKKPTFWLLEGLVYYMSEESNQRLVKAIDALSAPRSQLWADISGFSHVKASADKNEGLFRSRAFKSGENDPTKGVLSTIQWSMDTQVSLDESQELYGREWQPIKVRSDENDGEETVPWFFVMATKMEVQPGEEPLL